MQLMLLLQNLPSYNQFTAIKTLNYQCIYVIYSYNQNRSFGDYALKFTSRISNVWDAFMEDGNATLSLGPRKLSRPVVFGFGARMFCHNEGLTVFLPGRRFSSSNLG